MSIMTMTRIVLLGTENNDGSVTGVTAGTGQPVQCAQYGSVKIIVRGIGTITGGSVVIEEADWGANQFAYSGTWSPAVSAVNPTALSGGAETAVVLPNTPYSYIRVRIASAITGGGTVLVKALLGAGIT